MSQAGIGNQERRYMRFEKDLANVGILTHDSTRGKFTQTVYQNSRVKPRYGVESQHYISNSTYHMVI